MSADTPRERYVSPAQVAELLDLSVTEVLDLVHEGRLSGALLGSSSLWRITEDSVNAYLEEQHEQARRMALWRQSNAASFPELW